MKQIHKAVQAPERHRILAAILDFVEEAEKRRKKVNVLGPICILQIFRKNPSRDVWLYYQILMKAKISNTEISTKILKRKKIRIKKVFIIRITPKALQLTARVRSFP